MKKSHAFILPLHNEEKVIQNTLQSLTYAGVNWNNVFLVDDGSQDQTINKLRKINFPPKNVLSIRPNVGKTRALIEGFKYFNLEERYEFLNTLDGDSMLREDYMKKLIPLLNDIPKSVVAVCSRVCALNRSWNPYVVYRIFEYWVMQNMYKKAQNYLNILTVLPGCGTTFRTELFKILTQTTDPSVVTEDFLWTIEIHKKQMGKMIYSHDTVVITQDPDRLKSYHAQNLRWYKGGWQVYLKQKMWKLWENKINLETSFLFGEGLFFSSLFVFALIAFFIKILPIFVHYFFLFDWFIFTLLGLSAALFEFNFRLVLYMPFFYLLRIVKCIVFLHSFISIVLFKSDKYKKVLWNKVARY